MKITVAILDKDAIFRGILLEELNRQAKQFGFEMCINGYSTPKELEENELPFDLLMMDTSFEAPFEDGIEWVKMQAPSLRYLQLMYVSGEEDKVFDTMRTEPVAFVRKSHLETDLPKALKRYREKLDSLPEFVVIAEGRKRHVYMPGDIVFFYSNGHYIDIFLENGDRKCVRGKMDDIERYLSVYGFLRVHTSYLVNIRHIDNVDRKKIYLCNKKMITPSRKYQKYVWEKLKVYDYEGMQEE